MNKKQNTILLVDDDGALNTLLQTQLVDEDIRVFIAEDGAKGLEIAMTEHPDLIVLDLMMPIKDGLETLKEIRADESWGKYVHIIILTGTHDFAKMADAIEQGITEYIHKDSATVDKIVEKIKNTLLAK